MVAHRLQIWLDEHGLGELGPNLAELGIDRLEDLRSLGKDDLTELGIPEGYVNRLLQAMGREVTGRLSIDPDALPVAVIASSDSPSTMGSLGSPTTPTDDMVLAQLNRAATASGKPKRRPRGSIRGSIHSRSKARSPGGRSDETQAAAFAAIAEDVEEESPPNRFHGSNKLQAFLRATGLEQLSEPLQEMGIEMYDDLLEFSQEDFESLGIEQHEALFQALHHGAGTLRRMTAGGWDAIDFAAPVQLRPSARPRRSTVSADSIAIRRSLLAALTLTLTLTLP